MAKLRLIRSTWLAEGVVQLEFADPAGADLPGWTPGAHLTLHLPNGQAREYSLCGDPADPSRYAVAVQLDPASRGGSACVHERLRVGEVIEVDGPKNNFALEDAPAYVLIAGGIGITPSISLLRTAADRGDRRPFLLVYANRTEADIVLAEELTGLAVRLDLTVVHVLSAPSPQWSGERGRISKDVLERHLPADLRGFEFFVCASPPAVQTTVDALAAAGVAPEYVHVERFEHV
jgi:ferredoxin-NADP reductase